MTTAQAIDAEARVFLRDFSAKKFDLGELRVLAFDLAINFDSLPHRTTVEFATELVSYFERREQLDFLARNILQRRPQNEELAVLLAALPPSSGRKKAQLIIAEDLVEDPKSFQSGLAEFLGVSPDDVMIMAMKTGSLRILIGFPAEAIERLFELEGVDLCEGEVHIISVEAFESLEHGSQAKWQSAAGKERRIQLWELLLHLLQQERISLSEFAARMREWFIFPITRSRHPSMSQADGSASTREEYPAPKQEEEV